MENQNADVRLVLEEMRRQCDQGLRTGELLDQKAGAILVAAGALIVVIIAMQRAMLSMVATILVVILAVAYAVAIILVLVSMRTRAYKLLLAPEWDEIDRRLFNETERDVHLVMISGYIEVIVSNTKVNHRKARFVDLGLGLLMAALLLTLILVLVQ